MSKALINHKIIEWAIKRSGIPEAKVAKDRRFKNVKSWISGGGGDKPTFKQAQELAKKLYLPFNYLYLNEPPEEKLEIPDFRKVNGKPSNPPSLNLLDNVNNALLKQEWFRDYLIEEGYPDLAFIGKFDSSQSNIKEVARDIAEITDYNQIKKNAKDWEIFIGKFVKSIEEKARIMVLRNSCVGLNSHRPLDVTEFRGFAIEDSKAPLIFINTRDSKTAQLFTIAHELAHLWIGKSGVSNNDITIINNDQKIEKFCNAVAAELLVPEEEFLTKWENAKSLEWQKQELCQVFKVSSRVIGRRAFDLKKIAFEVYKEFDEAEQEKFDKAKEKSNQNKGFPDKYRFTRVNSNLFVETILRSLAGKNNDFIYTSKLLFSKWNKVYKEARVRKILK